MSGYNFLKMGLLSTYVGKNKPQLISCSPSMVVVEYSFQDEDLLNHGIENLEDFYDSFAIYIVDNSGGLVEILSYECS